MSFYDYKIHYQIFDSLGNVVQVLVDNDGKDTTGVAGVDNDGDAVKGIESIISYERDIYGNVTETRNNLNAQGEVEETVYTVRDAHGRETAKYWDLDNNVNTGTGNVNQDPAILTLDGRSLKGIERYETYAYDANGNLITKNSNLDAKGGFENIEYYDVNKATGEREGVYYNRDNDSKDNTPLAAKTGETVTLKDGRTVEGIDNFTTYERNEHKQVIQENFNLDAKGAFDRVYYYDLDVNGNRVGEYQNLDNDTTKTLSGESQITGTTHQLADGREVSGIERYYSREFDSNNRLMKIENNLDGKGQYESVTYYERDGYGREVLRYTNANNDMFSNGTPNPTGHSYTITQNGEAVTVNGIDQVVRTTYNEYGSATKVEINNTGEAGDDKFTHVSVNEYNERRQKVADEATINGQKSAASAYTYDIYGRQATRSFDSDFSEGKEGFERIDTYHYDEYGRQIRADRDFTGDELSINSYSKNEFDIYGRVSVERVFDSKDVLTNKKEFGYDAYGQRVKEITYATEDSINIQFLTERDEYGRGIKSGRDLNMSGVLDLGDNYRVTTYNDQGQVYKSYDVYANGNKTVTSLWFYDEIGRRAYTVADANDNDKWDDGEAKYVDTYHGTRTDRDETLTYTYPDDVNPTKILKFVYQNAGDQGTQIGTLDAPQGKEFKSFSHNVYGSVVSSTEDYTTEHWNRFFEKVGGNIEVINMSDARAKTEITLDNDVLSKITGTRLRVWGESTDTVNLKDSAEFTKLDNTVRFNGHDYAQYTTEVGGSTYTVLIDADVNVNML